MHISARALLFTGPVFLSPSSCFSSNSFSVDMCPVGCPFYGFYFPLWFCLELEWHLLGCGALDNGSPDFGKRMLS